MGLPEIYLEHKKGERHRKLLRVKPEHDLFVIGSSRDADLRIAGEGVQGCHAVLRFRAPHWYVCDISGSENVKVNGQVVSEARLDGSMAFEIGQHRIQLFAKEGNAELFGEGAKGDGAALHQVVIRARGRVVETRLLPANQNFLYHDGDRSTSLPAPRDGKWVKTQIGSRTVQQRLVAAQEILTSERLQFDRDLRKPFFLALAVFALMFSSIALLSMNAEEKPEVALDKKSMEIIFNAKSVKKKRLEAQKAVSAAKAKAGGSSQQPAAQLAANSAPEESQSPQPAKEKSPRALTSLRQSGLANLVGKIAKRANKQGVLVAAVGVNPDNSNSGRAFYSTGSSTTGGGGSASKAGPTYKLGGVATQGRAGGTGDYKAGTALAGGKVGAGDVVAMVDDETVIEGGLDRDAIAEVIRRNLGQIRYCYERQLSSNPDLYGKVLVKFTIGAAGEVIGQRVDSSTLKNSMVEGCIMRRMANWKFPEPKGGTQVNVSYPFLFKAN